MEAPENGWPIFIPEQPSLQGNQPRKRFKESCDNCGSSKAKCSKDRPVCSRCDERGIACFYSPSQRSKKAQEPDLELTWPVNPPLDLTFDDFLKKKSGSFVMDSNFSWDDCLLMDLDETGSSLISSDVTPSIQSATFFSPEPEQSPSNVISRDIPTSFPFPSSFEGISVFLNASAPAPLSTASSPKGVTDLKIPKSQATSQDDPYPELQCEDCLSLTLDIVKVLHIPSNTCRSSKRNPSSSTLTPRSTPSLNIEEITSTNEIIIERLKTILQCACSDDPQFQLFLAFIICKTMQWYRAIIPSPSTLEPSSSTNSKSAANLVALPVSKYYLENNMESDGMKIRAQLVLSKLHHVIRLMEQLATCLRGQRCELQPSRGPRQDEKNQPSIGGSLEVFLRQSVRAMTKEIIDTL